jgi:hypothetical protein
LTLAHLKLTSKLNKPRMHKIILMMLLAIVSSSSMAEWLKIQVSSNDMVTAYANPANIHKAGTKVKMWSLLDHKTADEILGKPYKSMMFQDEYDCKESLLRNLSLSFYSENMGGGEVIDTNSNTGKWQPVSPGTLEEALLKRACVKK